MQSVIQSVTHFQALIRNVSKRDQISVEHIETVFFLDYLDGLAEYIITYLSSSSSHGLCRRGTI